MVPTAGVVTPELTEEFLVDILSHIGLELSKPGWGQLFVYRRIHNDENETDDDEGTSREFDKELARQSLYDKGNVPLPDKQQNLEYNQINSDKHLCVRSHELVATWRTHPLQDFQGTNHGDDTKRRDLAQELLNPNNLQHVNEWRRQALRAALTAPHFVDPDNPTFLLMQLVLKPAELLVELNKLNPKWGDSLTMSSRDDRLEELETGVKRDGEEDLDFRRALYLTAFARTQAKIA